MKMRKSGYFAMVCGLALLGVQQSAHAQETIYDFSTGSAYGFTGNGATAALGTVPSGFPTSGQSALEITNKATQTYGGALTATVPVDLINSPTFSITFTLPVTPVDASNAPVYFDIVPVYYSTDGELDPDTTNSADFVNIGGVAPGTYTYTVDQNFFDPDGVLPTDSTPGEILLADNAYDATASPPTTDSITGFQLTIEHGEDGSPPAPATTIYIDNITVPGVSVPEPASLGILGAGGLLLTRRRRA